MVVCTTNIITDTSFPSGWSLEHGTGAVIGWVRLCEFGCKWNSDRVTIDRGLNGL